MNPGAAWSLPGCLIGIGFEDGRLTDGNDILFLGVYLCVVGVLMLVKWLTGRGKKDGDAE